VNPALRVAIAAIFAAASAALLFPIYLGLRAGGNKVFEPQSFDFALVAVAAFAIALGALIVPWRSATAVAVLGLLSGAGLLFGALAIFSIGLVVLPVAIVLLVVLARAIRRAPLSAARRSVAPSWAMAWCSFSSVCSFRQRSSASRTAVAARRASGGTRAEAVTP
jgi:hypothetical protein